MLSLEEAIKRAFGKDCEITYAPRNGSHYKFTHPTSGSGIGCGKDVNDAVITLPVEKVVCYGWIIDMALCKFVGYPYNVVVTGYSREDIAEVSIDS